MKSKKINPQLAGLMLLFVVILAAGVYYVLDRNHQEAVVLEGYLGGEKIGLFEDQEVQDILNRRYHIKFDYARAGSLEMVRLDQEGMDYLFPSSQIALEYYEEQHGAPLRSQIVFNTPIVLYTRRMVLDALESQGIVSQEQGVYYADMEKLADLIVQDVSWSSIGLPELYGNVSIDTTDPADSNSGNMFAGLLANVLNGGKTVDETTVDQILPQLQQVFRRLGYMESSSSDLFSQFLKMGVGAHPIIAGYESQLLEFSVSNPEDYQTVKDDIVMIYPSPTVWSTHVYLGLTDSGVMGMEALMDEEVQKLAWEKHGFRTGLSLGQADSERFDVPGLAGEITQVMPVPDYRVMKVIIEGLDQAVLN